MDGPEWGWPSIDGRDEIIDAAPDDVVWSDDGQYMAFVRLHVQDVPNRQEAEGINYEVGIVRLAGLGLTRDFPRPIERLW